jgi:hypothetical protein
MDVVTDVGEQSWIAQLLQPEIVNERGKRELARSRVPALIVKMPPAPPMLPNARMMRRHGARSDAVDATKAAVNESRLSLSAPLRRLRASRKTRSVVRSFKRSARKPGWPITWDRHSVM